MLVLTFMGFSFLVFGSSERNLRSGGCLLPDQRPIPQFNEPALTFVLTFMICSFRSVLVSLFFARGCPSERPVQ
jgi:hypothetical protein